MQRSTTTTPDEHLASLPDEVRPDLQTLDAAISREMSGEERVLWEGRFWGGSEQRIIGYGAYTYTGSNRKPVDWFIVGLAAQKHYITVFVTAVEGGAYLAERYAERLGRAKVGRSSISFKRLADIDLGALLELVRRARLVMVG